MSDRPLGGAPALTSTTAQPFTETYRSPAWDPAGISVSLVVPAFNESGRLHDGLGRLFEAFASGSVEAASTEIIVVDDASTDCTAKLARQLLADAPQVRVLRLERHTGKGGCVRVGVGQAQGRRLAFVDADMAIVPSQLPSLLQALELAQVAIGSRELPGSKVDSSSLLRNIGGRGFNKLVQALTDVEFTDTQCGFKAFWTPVARLLFHCSVIDGFAFDVEILHVANRLGLAVAEVPVRWLRIEGSRIHFLSDPLRMLRDVAAVRLGLRRAPPVPALAIASELSTHAVREAADPAHPVLDWGERGTLVLFPLAEPASCRHLAQRLRTVRPGTNVRQLSLSLSQLEELAPLALVHPPPG